MHPYPMLLDEMFRSHALLKTLEALRASPMTAVELSRSLQLRVGMVRFTIGQLRKVGHVIENRGSKGGPNGRRGSYHLRMRK